MRVAHQPCASAVGPQRSCEYGASASGPTPAPAPRAGLTVTSPLLDASHCTHRKSALLICWPVQAAGRVCLPALQG